MTQIIHPDPMMQAAQFANARQVQAQQEQAMMLNALGMSIYERTAAEAIDEARLADDPAADHTLARRLQQLARASRLAVKTFVDEFVRRAPQA